MIDKGTLFSSSSLLLGLHASATLDPSRDQYSFSQSAKSPRGHSTKLLQHDQEKEIGIRSLLYPSLGFFSVEVVKSVKKYI